MESKIEVIKVADGIYRISGLDLRLPEPEKVYHKFLWFKWWTYKKITPEELFIKYFKR